MRRRSSTATFWRMVASSSVIVAEVRRSNYLGIHPPRGEGVCVCVSRKNGVTSLFSFSFPYCRTSVLSNFDDSSLNFSFF
jgi:hypothetical protein